MDKSRFLCYSVVEAALGTQGTAPDSTLTTSILTTALKASARSWNVVHYWLLDLCTDQEGRSQYGQILSVGSNVCRISRVSQSTAQRGGR